MWFYKITKKRAYLFIVDKSDFGKIVIDTLIDPITSETGKPYYRLSNNRVISHTYDYEKNYFNSLDEITTKILRHRKQHYIIETLFTGEHKLQDH